MLVQGYILLLLILVGLLGKCMFNMEKINNDLARVLSRLNLFGMFSILANIIFAAAISREFSCVGFSVFSAGIGWMLLYLFLFATNYPSYTVKMNSMIYIAVFFVTLDTISLLINPITHHVFYLEEHSLLGKYDIFVIGESKFFYRFHLFMSYALVAFIIFTFMKKAIRTSKFYRRKYTIILMAFLVVIILDALCVAFRLPLNISIIFYGVLSITLSYYSMNYEPKQLIQNMQAMIMENLKNGIACFDSQGKCIYANTGIFQMFQIPHDVKILEECTYENQREKICLEEAYSVWHEERAVKGEMKYFEIERQNIYDRRHIFVGSYFNITDRTQEHRMYEKEITAAKNSSNAKSEFLSRVSHDIRTPVNSIFGMNEMILRESREQKTQEYALHIKDAVSILINLINDVLDFSKIEAGKMHLVLREYSLSEMLDGINNIISIQAMKKGLQYHCELAADLPSKLRGDDVRIGQILLNLLGNAVKYTPEGSVTLKIWCEEKKDTMLQLHVVVEDTGIGIKEDDIPKLFNAFQRLEETKNHSIQGSGLGLNITAYLLRLMNSNLEVKSTFGKGSSFGFVIDQEIIDATSMSGLEENSSETTTDYEAFFEAPDARILVVDDNEINRFVFISLLSKTKMQIDEVSSGAQCLDVTQKTRYNMIFMDHMMPEMDGIETLHRLREQKQNLCVDIPVIALTANVVSGAKEMYLHEGFDGYLTKPFDPDEVEKMICSFLPEELVTRRRENE